MQPFHFMQLADMQFGMFAHFSGMSDEEIADRRARGINVTKAPKIEGFADETRLFMDAISEANRLRPAFVVVCGDMIQHAGSAEETAEVLRIAGLLHDGIPIYWVAGNHDIASDTFAPTPEDVAMYRAAFGADYYAFQHGGASFIVLDTVVMDHPEHVPGEWEAQLSFLERELRAARDRGSEQVIVFCHHPLFLARPDEDNNYWNVPPERRDTVLELLTGHGVSAVFAGHWHRNNYATGAGLQMVASGPVGYPLGDDPSGYRIIRLSSDAVEHDYYAFGQGPLSVHLGA